MIGYVTIGALDEASPCHSMMGVTASLSMVAGQAMASKGKMDMKSSLFPRQQTVSRHVQAMESWSPLKRPRMNDEV